MTTLMTTNIYRRVRILPYKVESNSARSLAKALQGKRLRLEGSRYTPQAHHLVINWGNSSGFPAVNGATVLNGNPDYLQRASNKLTFFQHMAGEPWLPQFWTNSEDIPDEAFPIVCRTKLTGHSGDGIVIASSRDDLVPAQLYVKYIKKKEEYRVHVGTYNNGQGESEYSLIDIQQKKRKLSNANPNWQVRNHANGFVYTRENVDPPLRVVECATAALAASELDFGAVDVIWNEKESKAYVLEINTAPGLEGTTLDRYTQYFNGNSPGLQMLGV